MTDKEQDDRIEELTQRIAELEDALRQVTRPYTELADQLGRFQGMVQRYFQLMDLYQKHGVISVEVILPQVKDPISKEVLRILLDHPGYNISEVTEELRVRTGSASRRIVRQRLASLTEQGLVHEEKGRKASGFHLSDDVVRKWSQMLGLLK